jgi:hypothetical protein
VQPESPAIAPAASDAEETRLKVGEPDFIRPVIGVHLDVMAASVIAAVD